MRDLSQCSFTGRLGADADLRYTASGQAVTNMRLAIGRDYKPKGGDEWKERTLWLQCRLWGKLGERAADLKKGTAVFVSGELDPDDYNDNDGKPVSKIQFNVLHLEVLDRPRRGDASAGASAHAPAQNRPSQAPRQPPSRPAHDPTGSDIEDDEIPF